MQLRGLKNYRAVWMLNILNILVSEHWEVTTNQGILHSDRSLYSTQSETFRLAVYVAPTDFQFILTEDGFGLYEGTVINVPSVVDQLLSTLEDHPAPSCIPIANTLTYAVSPRLVLMLQASHMTREQSRVNQGVPRSLTRAQLYGQTLTESYFSDYPLSQVRVTYSPPLAPGALENCIRDKYNIPISGDKEAILKPPMIGDRPLSSRLGDQLTFQTHHLTRSQAEKVNSLQLTNLIGVITFISPAALLSSIEVYEKYCPLYSNRPIHGPPRFGKIPFGSLKRQLREVITLAGVGESASGVHTSPTPAAPPLGTSLDPTPMGQSKPQSSFTSLPPPPTSSPSLASLLVVRSSGSSISTSLPGLRGAFSRVSKPKLQPALTPSSSSHPPSPPSPSPVPCLPPLTSPASEPSSASIDDSKAGDRRSSVPGKSAPHNDEMAHSLVLRDTRVYYLSLLLLIVLAVLYARLASDL